MARAGLVLFDDRKARDWEPFALTRPAGELLFGTMRLVERIERAFGLECTGYLTSEHLADFEEPGARPVIDLDALPVDRDTIYWCARAVPTVGQPVPEVPGPTIYVIDGQPVGMRVPAGGRPDAAFLDHLAVETDDGDETAVDGQVLEWIWDVLLESPEQVGRDLTADASPAQAALPTGAHKLGDYPVILGRDVSIEPGTVFDAREGPIRIEDGVQVRSFTRLAGPSFIGPRSHILGGSYEQISTGPYSYLRGEVAESVVLGYTNKAHDGHIGHGYLGRWVNLGAFTTNSDLKNNYGPVKVWTPNGLQDSGRMKMGCLIGDHVKTGIGLLLTTGIVVGAGANLYGTTMPPRYVQPFSWGEGSNLGEYRLTQFLDTAAKAMARRKVELDDRGRRHLERCWHKGRGG
jgi:UDP-N-acetylglucosamine diphosphorylase/glucosamine-1-phosphate N-acetyltransferase